MVDAVVIGMGPAGISASIYIKRAGFNVIVIGKDGGALENAQRIDNYYGFPDGISGKELIDNGIKQAQNIGIEVIEDEVVNISYEEGFKILTKKNSYECRALIIASGTSRITPKIKGLKELEGKGVSYCAVCDGFFFKGKDVAVLGSGDYALHEAMELLPIVKSVTMLTDGKEPIEHRSEEIKTNVKKIEEIRGETRVEKVGFVDNTEVEVSGLFIAEGIASSIDFARKLGATIENNKIEVNENMRTNIPGLYACGDCTGGLLQVSKAVADGAKAGIDAIRIFKKTLQRNKFMK